jgi:hypothetical protein
MKFLARIWRGAAAHGPDVVRELVGLGGAGLIAYGAWLLHPSAGYIVGGMLMVAGAWLHSRVAT